MEEDYTRPPSDYTEAPRTDPLPPPTNPSAPPMEPMRKYDTGIKPKIAKWLNGISFVLTMVSIIILLWFFLHWSPVIMCDSTIFSAFAITGVLYGLAALTQYKSYRCLDRCIKQENCI